MLNGHLQFTLSKRNVYLALLISAKLLAGMCFYMLTQNFVKHKCKFWPFWFIFQVSLQAKKESSSNTATQVKVEDISEKTPFRWSTADKHQYLDLANNEQDVRYNSEHHKQVEEQDLFPTARAAQPVNTQTNFLYEILIVDSGQNNEIGVGVTGATCKLGK